MASTHHTHTRVEASHTTLYITHHTSVQQITHPYIIHHKTVHHTPHITHITHQYITHHTSIHHTHRGRGITCHPMQHTSPPPAPFTWPAGPPWQVHLPLPPTTCPSTAYPPPTLTGAPPPPLPRPPPHLFPWPGRPPWQVEARERNQRVVVRPAMHHVLPAAAASQARPHQAALQQGGGGHM